jgi:hypothetical protein
MFLGNANPAATCIALNNPEGTTHPEQLPVWVDRTIFIKALSAAGLISWYALIGSIDWSAFDNERILSQSVTISKVTP